MNQEERIDIYTIPPNFAEEGTMFSGRIKTRNAVETAVLLLVLVPVIIMLDTTLKNKLYIGMIAVVPVVILAVMGVQGESLFAFIASFFRFIKRRRCMSIPDERYRLEQNRRKEKAARKDQASQKKEATNKIRKKRKGGRKTSEAEHDSERTEPEVEEGAAKGQEGTAKREKNGAEPETAGEAAWEDSTETETKSGGTRAESGSLL